LTNNNRSEISLATMYGLHNPVVYCGPFIVTSYMLNKWLIRQQCKIQKLNLA